MNFTKEEKQGIKEILHETIMEDSLIFDDLLKNIKKFRESPEGRLAVVETKIDELKEDFKEFRTELKGDVAGLRTELKGDIDELKTEFNGSFNELKINFRNMMIWMFGIIMTMYGGFIVFLISKLGK